jgi:hypothetical protein
VNIGSTVSKQRHQHIHHPDSNTRHVELIEQLVQSVAVLIVDAPQDVLMFVDRDLSHDTISLQRIVLHVEIDVHSDTTELERVVVENAILQD